MQCTCMYTCMYTKMKCYASQCKRGQNNLHKICKVLPSSSSSSSSSPSSSSPSPSSSSSPDFSPPLFSPLLASDSFFSPLKHCQLLHENSGCGFQFHLQTAIKKMIVALCPKIDKEKLYKKESREGNSFPKKLYEKGNSR